jgi:hypothetical protein
LPAAQQGPAGHQLQQLLAALQHQQRRRQRRGQQGLWQSVQLVRGQLPLLAGAW